MKKIVIVGALVLVTAFIGMPYIVGVVAEKATHNMVENLNEDSDIYGNTEIVSYQRSFGSTQASYKMALPSSFDEFSLSFNEIEYQCDASHGFVNYSYTCNILSAGEYKEFINEHLAGEDPFSIEGQISIFGKLTQVMKLDAFKIEKDGGVLEVGSGLIEAVTDKNLRDYVLEGEFSGMSVTDTDMSGVLGKVAVEGDLTITEDKLQFGTMTLDFSKVDVKAANSDVSLEDFTFELDSKDHGETIAFDYLIKMKKLLVSNPADSYDLENSLFEIKASGLDRNSVVELSELLREYSKQNGELTPEQTFKALPLVEAMLRKDLAFSIDFKTDFQKQTLKSNFDINLIDTVSIAELSGFALNPESALDKLTISTSTVIPDSVIKKEPSISFVLLSNPLFQQSEGGFKNDLVLKKDNVSLNGEKTTLNDLISTVMQSVPR